jgi:hypothetical protein
MVVPIVRLLGYVLVLCSSAALAVLHRWRGIACHDGASLPVDVSISQHRWGMERTIIANSQVFIHNTDLYPFSPSRLPT